ncbi:hypothetical protein Pelo_10890 [Pelomyxa schiedti]|nr:hypothetical protein Pelo_10890 [Pelomyxa schiedti]
MAVRQLNTLLMLVLLAGDLRFISDWRIVAVATAVADAALALWLARAAMSTRPPPREGRATAAWSCVAGLLGFCTPVSLYYYHAGRGGSPAPPLRADRVGFLLAGLPFLFSLLMKLPTISRFSSSQRAPAPPGPPAHATTVTPGEPTAKSNRKKKSASSSTPLLATATTTTTTTTTTTPTTTGSKKTQKKSENDSWFYRAPSDKQDSHLVLLIGLICFSCTYLLSFIVSDGFIDPASVLESTGLSVLATLDVGDKFVCSVVVLGALGGLVQWNYLRFGVPLAACILAAV